MRAISTQVFCAVDNISNLYQYLTQTPMFLFYIVVVCSAAIVMFSVMWLRVVSAPLDQGDSCVVWFPETNTHDNSIVFNC